MKVINFFGGAGVGKSSQAAGLFYAMKQQGYNVELINEYAKEMVWEEHASMMPDQLYLMAQQHRKQLRLVGKVDYCITDSPMLLNVVYRHMYGEPTYSELLDHLSIECFNKYSNINILMARPQQQQFESKGRLQDYHQSLFVDQQIEKLLTKLGENYIKISYDHNPDPINDILEYVKEWPREA
jgi:hypothetical protein